jgi:serine protease
MRRPLSTLAALCLVLASLAWRASPVEASAVPADSARVIVKFKADSPLLREHALSANARHAERAQTLGQRIGLALRSGAGLGERSQVVLASGIGSAALAATLARQSDVEYAVVDQRRHRATAPNDPYYLQGPAVVNGGGGPVAGQWYLRAPSGAVVSSIDVEPAWGITTGSPAIVVAVLDTGVRFEHPDFKRVSDGGNLLPGYDMIHDAAVANDGDGRDADASDPGDWVTQADVDRDPTNCTDSIGSSSWHGTQTIGLIGAITDNGIGIAGVGRNVRILPVRVLGKCGGFDSDIIAGMRWAAGLSVPGVPDNSNPARVLNLSLGSEGACTAAYADAVAAVNAVGALVVASAGNSAGHAVSTPANCSGVIAVSGLRHAGSKVGFSDIGPQISLSAPGGNCVNIGAGDACLYPIMTTSNAGAMAPGASIYTDSFNASVGTSFSAPLVAGTAALMLSAQPALTPRQLKLLLQATARPFPTSGADNGSGDPTPVLECTAPQYDSNGQPVDQLQCYCSTGTCGAGMLDAGAAVLAASSGTPAPSVQARIDIAPTAPLAGQALSLQATNSSLAGGHSIASYQWELLDGGGIVADIASPSGAIASVTPAAAGRFTVRLTVQDNTGASSSARLTVAVPAVAATTPSGSGGGGGGGGGALGLAWLAALAAAVLALRWRSGM